MIKFFFDAMYYQFFIYNRDKFKLEDPHERTVLLFCGILFLPIIALREKPLLFKSQRLSSIISWMVYPFLAVLLYFMITHRHWLKII